jgi:hypothetical protein
MQYTTESETFLRRDPLAGLTSSQSLRLALRHMGFRSVWMTLTSRLCELNRSKSLWLETTEPSLR